MKSTDKFLVGIVIGILALIIVAFGIVYLRPEPEYKPDETPEDIVHNYLLAIQNEDYERAYGYLSPTLPGYPRDAGEFLRHIEDNSWRFRRNRNTTLVVESSTISGQEAVVQVLESRFSGGDIFGGDQSFSTFEVELSQHQDEWKVTEAKYYFARCWLRSEGCR